MFKEKKVIIFDMDGTLIDSVGIWNKVDMELIKELGSKEKLNEYDIQKQRDNKLVEFSGSENPYIGYCEFLGLKYGSKLIGEEILNIRNNISLNYQINEIDYKKGAPELIKYLKDNNYILVIATTTRKKDMDIYYSKNKNIIKKANIKEYFSKVYTRENVKEIKPNPEIFLRILDEFKVKKKECLIFEDSLIGINAANNAGIDVVAIYDKYSDKERDIINEKATYNRNGFDEVIKDLIKENI